MKANSNASEAGRPQLTLIRGGMAAGATQGAPGASKECEIGAVEAGVYLDENTLAGAVNVRLVAPDGRCVMDALLDARCYELLRDAGVFDHAEEVLRTIPSLTDRRARGKFTITHARPVPNPTRRHRGAAAID
ncbi:MAG TPA: hypothetical protein VFK13_07100 [Gemmatimonadaceae bacterium]|nr:hypothetical protein [Gemmatimonadaceae bacterium]